MAWLTECSPCGRGWIEKAAREAANTEAQPWQQQYSPLPQP